MGDSDDVQSDSNPTVEAVIAQAGAAADAGDAPTNQPDMGGSTVEERASETGASAEDQAQAEADAAAHAAGQSTPTAHD